MEKELQGLRIFIVCPRLCHGGAERVAVSLANGFVSKGHKVMFFTDLFEEQTYILNESIDAVNLVSTPKNKIRKWGSAIRILRIAIKKDKPDVIIGIMSLCSLIAKIAAIGTKVVVVATEHNAFERPDSSPMSLWDQFYKFHISKIFKCMTVLTEADKRVLGEKRKNVVVMPNPLAISPIEAVPEKKRIILAAGRVDQWYVKGFDVLIKAWANVVSSLKSQVINEGWKLQIAGAWRDPKNKEYLDGIAQECGVGDSIDYLGFVSDMKLLYQDASIFVLSSRYEGFGLVLIEAMSQGCACVACDYKGRQQEIIKDDSQGLCCEPDDVVQLSNCIMRLISDEQYSLFAAQNGLKRAQYYQINHIINKWEELILCIINKQSLVC